MGFIKINKQLLNELNVNELEKEITFNTVLGCNTLFVPSESLYGVTKNKSYKLFKSNIDNEYVFIDDSEEESLVWIAVNGDFLIDKNVIPKNIYNLISI